MNNFDVHPGKIDILIRLKIIGGGNKIMYEWKNEENCF